jgi:hypothetical protein
MGTEGLKRGGREREHEECRHCRRKRIKAVIESYNSVKYINYLYTLTYSVTQHYIKE